MSRTLQIEQSAAITAYENAKKSEKRLLEDLLGKQNLIKDLREVFKEFDDILEVYGFSAPSWAAHCASRNLTERQIGMEEIEMVVEIFNQGGIVDFTNKNQIKRWPIFEMGSPSGVGFRLGDVVSTGRARTSARALSICVMKILSVTQWKLSSSLTKKHTPNNFYNYETN